METTNHRLPIVKLLQAFGACLAFGFLGHQTRPIVLSIAERSPYWARRVHDGIGAVIISLGTCTAYWGMPDGIRCGPRLILASVVSWIFGGAGVLIGDGLDALLDRHSGR